MNPQDLEVFFTSAFGIVVGIFLLILLAATILMPLAVLMIHRQMHHVLQILKAHGGNNETPLHQTKLLTEIRDSLRSMQAVGIETEEHEAEAPMLPAIRNPSSVPPARERLRR